MRLFVLPHLSVQGLNLVIPGLPPARGCGGRGGEALMRSPRTHEAAPALKLHSEDTGDHGGSARRLL
jgi:hypothetical protein